MMISLALLTIIMGGSASLVLVASRGLANDVTNVGSDAVAARSATDQIADDIKVATAITEQSATALTVTVPDRDGDTLPETIRYVWSGVPGDPLTRQYNTRAAATIAKNVHSLNFSYLSKTAGKPPPVEGEEASLSLHNSATSANWVGYQLTDAKGAAGSFAAPTMPDNAISWRPTRCRVMLQRGTAATGTATVSVRYADTSGKPTGAVLATGSVAIINVLESGASWVDVPFTTTSAVEVGKAACLVVSYVKITGLTGAYVFADSVSTDTPAKFATTADSGANWTSVTGGSLQFGLWGKITTQEPETLDFQPLPSSP